MEGNGPSPTELGIESHEGFEKAIEEPKSEGKSDITPSMADILYENPQTSADKEKKYIADMLAKYPPEQRKSFDNSDGIEVVYLGGDEISPKITQQVGKAKELLKAKCGDKLSDVFKDLKVYYVRGEAQGGGWALSGANAITMNTDTAIMTIEEAEKMLGPDGAQILNEGDWKRVFQNKPEGVQTISGEMTLVHEIGHILQAKTGTKIPDTQDAPTKYGRSKEWEDYAESFMYYCYDKPLNRDRSKIIAQDIAKVISFPTPLPKAA